MRCLTNDAYVVSQQYATVPADGKAVLTFRADAAPFVFDRLNIGAPSDVLDVLRVERAQINGELDVLGTCHAKALNRLFRLSRLSRPFVIAANNTLDVTVFNPSGTDAVVNIKLLPSPSSDRMKLTSRYIQPRILTIFKELDAEAQQVELRAESYPASLFLARFVTAADDEDALRYTLRLQQQLLRREEYPQQTLDEMEGFRLFAPIRLDSRERLTFDLTNDAATANVFSFVAEAQSVAALSEDVSAEVASAALSSGHVAPNGYPTKEAFLASMPRCSVQDQTVETLSPADAPVRYPPQSGPLVQADYAPTKYAPNEPIRPAPDAQFGTQYASAYDESQEAKYDERRRVGYDAKYARLNDR